jgi:hypothetical protein
MLLTDTLWRNSDPSVSAPALCRARASEHEIDVATAALRAHQPLGPFAHRRLGALACGLLGLDRQVEGGNVA